MSVLEGKPEEVISRVKAVRHGVLLLLILFFLILLCRHMYQP